MHYFNKCPICGANLDPGETCDCREVEKEKQAILKEIFDVKALPNRQLVLGGFLNE